MTHIFASHQALKDEAEKAISSLSSPSITDAPYLRDTLIDPLLWTALFSPLDELKQIATHLIYQLAEASGVHSSSIYPLYKAFGKGEIDGFTVPALNIRTLTFDVARLIFGLMKQDAIGPVVFEIARSEIEYTHQPPREYAISILAAAIKEDYRGPVFLQGDHYQFSAKNFAADTTKEIEILKSLIKESLDAKFCNIDIDASTLVDLSKGDLRDQQRNNSEMTALLTGYVRGLENGTVPISLGGEIGHIGGRNSTVEDFKAFMTLYQQAVTEKGISKISVQTGTSHGGTPLADGTIQEVHVDMNVLESISTVAREKYHIGGAVQHGASTLPLTTFDEFVKNKTLEIHLATGLQNTIYDALPKDIQQDLYSWIDETFSEDKKEDQTQDQFIYTNRKKAFGPFKQLLWDLSAAEKAPLLKELTGYLSPIFTKLNLHNTRAVLDRYYPTS